MKVFVYGTLLKGQCRASVLAHADFLGCGFTPGVLLDLGCYPGFIPGKNMVYGELYEVSEDVLCELDRIEGYDEEHKMDSLYLRKRTRVTLTHDGSSQEADLYFYNGECNRAQEIACGDYRRYQMERSLDQQWYMAYGSNMSSPRLIARVGSIDVFTKGWISDYQLVFNKRPHQGHGAYANLRYAPGHQCPSVAYRLSSAQLQALDLCEGTPSHYIRLGMPEGYVYVAHPQQLVWDRMPSPDYLEHIYQGYEEHGFETHFLPPLG